MIDRTQDRGRYEEPIYASDLLSDEEWARLSDAERDRLYDEDFAKFRAWSLEVRRKAEEEIRKIERNRGLFGISTSV